MLEVILALVLFVAAAAVITVGLNASMNSVERLRLNVHATDLAVTVMSELQLGIRSPDDTGPEPFSGSFTNWTWEVSSVPVEETEGSGRFAKVEVVVRHDDPVLMYRLCQILALGAVESTSGMSQ